MTGWQHERALARTTVGWGLGSVAAGLLLAVAGRSRPWWRAFGWQHAGWGAVDLVIAVVAEGSFRTGGCSGTPIPTRRQGPSSRSGSRSTGSSWPTAIADAGYVGLGIGAGTTPVTGGRRGRGGRDAGDVPAAARRALRLADPARAGLAGQAEAHARRSCPGSLGQRRWVERWTQRISRKAP